jgi:GH25 family lysozyme M1 (1,4-beta-N-acetylmuramidase)
MRLDHLVIDPDDFNATYAPEARPVDLGARMCAAGAVDGEEDPGGATPPAHAAVGPEPAGATGPDVSDHQPSVDWRAVQAAGHGIGIAKASEGLSWRSRTFPRRWGAIAEAGLIRGAYHFARPQPGRTGREEAEAFLRVVDAAGGFRPGDLRPILDIEAFGSGGRLSRQQTLGYAYDFALAVKERVGRLPIIYTGAFWRDQMGNPDNSLGCHLWLAAYVRDPTPFIPLAWRQTGWSIWQHTSRGACPGVPTPCDLNVVRAVTTLDKLRLPGG